MRIALKNINPIQRYLFSTPGSPAISRQKNLASYHCPPNYVGGSATLATNLGESALPSGGPYGGDDGAARCIKGVTPLDLHATKFFAQDTVPQWGQTPRGLTPKPVNPAGWYEV